MRLRYPQFIFPSLKELLGLDIPWSLLPEVHAAEVDDEASQFETEMGCYSGTNPPKALAEAIAVFAARLRLRLRDLEMAQERITRFDASSQHAETRQQASDVIDHQLSACNAAYVSIVETLLCAFTMFC